jgi:hypothetical protein
MNENPLQLRGQVPLELEVETNRPTFQKLKIICSCENMLVTITVLLLGLCLFFVFFSFPLGFQREGLWVIFALAVLTWLIALSFIARTCIAIVAPSSTEKHTVGTKTKKGTCWIVTLYNDIFDINGKSYLVKMYLAELIEHAQQVYSLCNIYLCLMPVELTTVICIILIIELLANIWATFHIHTQEIRDRLLLLDLLTDVVCVAFPLLYSWVFFSIPVRVSELLIIAVYPTLSALSKLNDLWEDYFKMDLGRIKNATSARSSRKRFSVLNLTQNRRILEMQLKHFPNWLRKSFVVANSIFVLFFASVIIVHVSSQPTADQCNQAVTREVWAGCRLEVPFCQNVFVPKCDCAVLNLLNYSQKQLPGSFGNLSSLLKMGVYTGNLEHLPTNIGANHKKIIVLQVVGNKVRYLPDSMGNLRSLSSLWILNSKLQQLPDSIGNLETLLYLYLPNNLLQSLPESLGNLRQLVALDVSNNRLQGLPASVGQLESLHMFYGNNNRIETLPENLGNLKRLRMLNVYNNLLKSLPDSVEHLQGLLYFHAWNNTLALLPNNIGNMKALAVIDVRRNNLTKLPDSIGELKHVEYLYLAGNPLCLLSLPNVGKLDSTTGFCESQCSADCPAYWLGDTVCGDNNRNYALLKDENVNLILKVKPQLNSGCNTAACHYDKGDCPEN